LKNYTVKRLAAARILRSKLQQRVACLDTLKVEICKENTPENNLVVVLCEFVSMLNQYVELIRRLLDSSDTERITISQQQLTIMKVYTTAIKSLEVKSMAEYNLSLQIH